MKPSISISQSHSGSGGPSVLPDLVVAYHATLAQRGWQPDDGQVEALRQLQALLERLVFRHDRSLGLFARVGRCLNRWCGGVASYAPMSGLYLWGGVGRGKTFLMDLFYEHCPLTLKLRRHYHRFMREIHQELSALQGEKNPLERVADGIASRASVLCLDEFFVKDIGDAMILANLLQALFDRGVVLVSTSNLVPDRLYEEGLQRQRFLPAIALLKQFTEVSEIGAGKDFRLRALTHSSLYLSPCGPSSELALEALMMALAPEAVVRGTSIIVSGRLLTVKAMADDVIWFDFNVLCGGPRSVADYIELAEDFTAVLISSVPRFDAATDDMARRFIHLVDEFYDRRVKLALSAACGPELLYDSSGRLAFEFERTVSRLREMQSEAYLSRRHGDS